MKKILDMIWNEPAVAVGAPTVVLAAAAGVWDNPALAFAAAAFAGLGTIFVRANVSADDPRGVRSTDAG